MTAPTDYRLPDYLPAIYDPARPDDDPEHRDHWAVAWTREHGLHTDTGIRNESGEHLADALELQVAERTILRRKRGRVAGQVRPGYVFSDCSGIVLLDAGCWLHVSPNGTTEGGRCEWHED